VTTAATLTSLLEAFLAEPGADALAVLADGCEEAGRSVGLLRRLGVIQLDALRWNPETGFVESVKVWVVKKRGGIHKPEHDTEAKAWWEVAEIVLESLTERCQSSDYDPEAGRFPLARDCLACRGRGWVLKG
jgi:hypothetical protein